MEKYLALAFAIVIVLLLAWFARADLDPAADSGEIDADEDGDGEAALAEQVWANEAAKLASEDGRDALRRLADEWRPAPPRESDNMIRRLREWSERQGGDAS